jgi:hypothetical protein
MIEKPDGNAFAPLGRPGMIDHHKGTVIVGHGPQHLNIMLL